MVLIAALAVITVTLGCVGVVGFFIAAITAYLSRGRGWPHLFGRALRLTFVLFAAAITVEIAVIAADLVFR